jgi:hypothetical protein
MFAAGWSAKGAHDEYLYWEKGRKPWWLHEAADRIAPPEEPPRAYGRTTVAVQGADGQWRDLTGYLAQRRRDRGHAVTPAELHAYVVARWQELLAIARAATPGPWCAYVTDASGGYVEQPEPATVASGNSPPDGSGGHLVAETPPCKDHPDRELVDADHIAAFNPAFSIAVCESALRRLKRHQPAPADCGRRCQSWPERYPCAEVLDDAAPFAERPDFPEELKRP